MRDIVTTCTTRQGTDWSYLKDSPTLLPDLLAHQAFSKMLLHRALVLGRLFRDGTLFYFSHKRGELCWIDQFHFEQIRSIQARPVRRLLSSFIHPEVATWVSLKTPSSICFKAAKELKSSIKQDKQAISEQITKNRRTRSKLKCTKRKA